MQISPGCNLVVLSNFYSKTLPLIQWIEDLTLEVDMERTEVVVLVFM